MEGIAIVEPTCRGYLIYMKSNGENDACFPVTKDNYTIGDGTKCDIRIRNENNNDCLCIIKTSSHKKAVIRNLHPKNPIFVNEKSIDSDDFILTHGDSIRICDRIFKWKYVEGQNTDNLIKERLSLNIGEMSKLEDITLKRFSEPAKIISCMEEETNNTVMNLMNLKKENEKKTDQLGSVKNLEKVNETICDSSNVKSLSSSYTIMHSSEERRHLKRSSSSCTKENRRSRSRILKTTKGLKLQTSTSGSFRKSCGKVVASGEENKTPSKEVKSRVKFGKSPSEKLITSRLCNVSRNDILQTENSILQNFERDTMWDDEELLDLNGLDGTFSANKSQIPKHSTPKYYCKDPLIPTKKCTLLVKDSIENINPEIPNLQMSTTVLYDSSISVDKNKVPTIKAKKTPVKDDAFNIDGSILVTEVNDQRFSCKYKKPKKSLDTIPGLNKNSLENYHNTRGKSNLLKKSFEANIKDGNSVRIENSLTTPEKSIIKSMNNTTSSIQELDSNINSLRNGLDFKYNADISVTLTNNFVSGINNATDSKNCGNLSSVSIRDNSSVSGPVVKCARNLSYISPPENNKSQEYMDSVVSTPKKESALRESTTEKDLTSSLSFTNYSPLHKKVTTENLSNVSTPKSPELHLHKQCLTGIVSDVGTPSRVCKSTKSISSPINKCRAEHSDIRDSLVILKSKALSQSRSSERKSTPLKANKSDKPLRDSVHLHSPIFEDYSLEKFEESSLLQNSENETVNDSRFKYVTMRRRRPLAGSSFAIENKIIEESEINQSDLSTEKEDCSSLISSSYCDKFIDSDDENSKFPATINNEVSSSLHVSDDSNDNDNAFNSTFTIDSSDMGPDNLTNINESCQANSVLPKSILTPFSKIASVSKDKTLKKVTFNFKSCENTNVSKFNTSNYVSDVTDCNSVNYGSETSFRDTLSFIKDSTMDSGNSSNVENSIGNKSQDTFDNAQLHIADESESNVLMNSTFSLKNDSCTDESGVFQFKKKVKRLSNVRVVKSPISGVKRLLKSPKKQRSPKVKSLNLDRVRKLLKTSTSVNSSAGETSILINEEPELSVCALVKSSGTISYNSDAVDNVSSVENLPKTPTLSFNNDDRAKIFAKMPNVNEGQENKKDTTTVSKSLHFDENCVKENISDVRNTKLENSAATLQDSKTNTIPSNSNNGTNVKSLYGKRSLSPDYPNSEIVKDVSADASNLNISFTKQITDFSKSMSPLADFHVNILTTELSKKLTPKNENLKFADVSDGDIITDKDKTLSVEKNCSISEPSDSDDNKMTSVSLNFEKKCEILHSVGKTKSSLLSSQTSESVCERSSKIFKEYSFSDLPIIKVSDENNKTHELIYDASGDISFEIRSAKSLAMETKENEIVQAGTIIFDVETEDNSNGNGNVLAISNLKESVNDSCLKEISESLFKDSKGNIGKQLNNLVLGVVSPELIDYNKTEILVSKLSIMDKSEFQSPQSPDNFTNDTLAEFEISGQQNQSIINEKCEKYNIEKTPDVSPQLIDVDTILKTPDYSHLSQKHITRRSSSICKNKKSLVTTPSFRRCRKSCRIHRTSTCLLESNDIIVQNDISSVPLENDILSVSLENDISSVSLKNDISSVSLKNDISSVSLENDILSIPIENEILSILPEDCSANNTFVENCQLSPKLTFNLILNQMRKKVTNLTSKDDENIDSETTENAFETSVIKSDLSSVFSVTSSVAETVNEIQTTTPKKSNCIEKTMLLTNETCNRTPTSHSKEVCSGARLQTPKNVSSLSQEKTPVCKSNPNYCSNNEALLPVRSIDAASEESLPTFHNCDITNSAVENVGSSPKQLLVDYFKYVIDELKEKFNNLEENVNNSVICTKSTDYNKTSIKNVTSELEISRNNKVNEENEPSSDGRKTENNIITLNMSFESGLMGKSSVEDSVVTDETFNTCITDNESFASNIHLIETSTIELPAYVDEKSEDTITSSKYMENIEDTLQIPKSPFSSYENVTGVKDLFRTPKSPVSSYENVIGVKKLFRTPKSPVSSYENIKGVKDLFKTPKSPFSSYENVEGVDNLLKTPKNPVSSYENGKDLFKISKSPFSSYENVEGVDNLLRTPKNPVSSYENGKDLFKISKSPFSSYENVEGVDNLLKTPKNPVSSYENGKDLFKISKSPFCSYENIEGINYLLKTPKSPVSGYENVKCVKTPKCGVFSGEKIESVENIVKPPRNLIFNDENIIGIAHSLKTPVSSLMPTSFIEVECNESSKESDTKNSEFKGNERVSSVSEENCEIMQINKSQNENEKRESKILEPVEIIEISNSSPVLVSSDSTETNKSMKKSFIAMKNTCEIVDEILRENSKKSDANESFKNSVIISECAQKKDELSVQIENEVLSPETQTSAYVQQEEVQSYADSQIECVEENTSENKPVTVNIEEELLEENLKFVKNKKTPLHFQKIENQGTFSRSLRKRNVSTEKKIWDKYCRLCYSHLSSNPNTYDRVRNVISSTKRLLEKVKENIPKRSKVVKNITAKFETIDCAEEMKDLKNLKHKTVKLKDTNILPNAVEQSESNVEISSGKSKNENGEKCPSTTSELVATAEFGNSSVVDPTVFTEETETNKITEKSFIASKIICEIVKEIDVEILRENTNKSDTNESFKNSVIISECAEKEDASSAQIENGVLSLETQTSAYVHQEEVQSYADSQIERVEENTSEKVPSETNENLGDTIQSNLSTSITNQNLEDETENYKPTTMSVEKERAQQNIEPGIIDENKRTPAPHDHKIEDKGTLSKSRPKRNVSNNKMNTLSGTKRPLGVEENISNILVAKSTSKTMNTDIVISPENQKNFRKPCSILLPVLDLSDSESDRIVSSSSTHEINEINDTEPVVKKRGRKRQTKTDSDESLSLENVENVIDPNIVDDNEKLHHTKRLKIAKINQKSDEVEHTEKMIEEENPSNKRVVEKRVTRKAANTDVKKDDVQNQHESTDSKKTKREIKNNTVKSVHDARKANDESVQKGVDEIKKVTSKRIKPNADDNNSLKSTDKNVNVTEKKEKTRNRVNETSQRVTRRGAANVVTNGEANSKRKEESSPEEVIPKQKKTGTNKINENVVAEKIDKSNRIKKPKNVVSNSNEETSASDTDENNVRAMRSRKGKKNTVASDEVSTGKNISKTLKNNEVANQLPVRDLNKLSKKETSIKKVEFVAESPDENYSKKGTVVSTRRMTRSAKNVKTDSAKVSNENNVKENGTLEEKDVIDNEKTNKKVKDKSTKNMKLEIIKENIATIINNKSTRSKVNAESCSEVITRNNRKQVEVIVDEKKKPVSKSTITRTVKNPESTKESSSKASTVTVGTARVTRSQSSTRTRNGK